MNTPTKVEYQFSCTTEPEITFDNLVAGIFTLNLSQSIGAVQTLTVAFEEADSDQLPAFSVKFEGPGHIFGNLSYPQLNAVKTLVRTLEGLLALQTDMSVDLKHIRVKAGDMEMVLGPAMGAVQSARPSQAFVEEMVRLSSLVTEHEVPLSFWRLGMAANSAGAVLEAFYYFWFFVERMFGEGKWREKELVKQLMGSDMLRTAMAHARSRIDAKVSEMLPEKQRCIYVEGDDEAVITHLVNTRGNLHHAKPTSDWHPGEPDPIRFHAAFLGMICQTCVGLLCRQALSQNETTPTSGADPTT